MHTAGGSETQFGTGHPGLFALTGLLPDPMPPVPGSRVVAVSSRATASGAPKTSPA
ncbi:hypothetical protein [Streptomyces ardesiacus]|uniref:Uncharacterized protein n=1 Tax=Streptomyces ardesiacus TaxID=285564 RepID=A0ABW8HCP7_9ACTN